MAKMKTYLFFREGMFYPVEEVSDEKVLKHVRSTLEPSVLRRSRAR